MVRICGTGLLCIERVLVSSSDVLLEMPPMTGESRWSRTETPNSDFTYHISSGLIGVLIMGIGDLQELVCIECTMDVYVDTYVQE
jgi:hypothetical protein